MHIWGALSQNSLDFVSVAPGDDTQIVISFYFSDIFATFLRLDRILLDIHSHYHTLLLSTFEIFLLVYGTMNL